MNNRILYKIALLLTSLILALTPLPIWAASCVVLTCCNVGMFSSFMSVLGMLDYYDTDHLSGAKVDFGVDGSFGLYHDPSLGPNWWDYYFEPIDLGQHNGEPIYTLNGPQGSDFAMHIEFQVPRKRANWLISRYVHVKPHILEKVDNFVLKNFLKDATIGIHFRGTDKEEAPRAAYEAFNEYIEVWRIIFDQPNAKIFIATDDQGFLNYMNALYPNQVVSYECFRSSDGQPVHFVGRDNYKKGEEALIDCLLLSRCNVLIKSSSNLSLCSAYFNPDMPMVHMTTRPWHEPLE